MDRENGRGLGLGLGHDHNSVEYAKWGILVRKIKMRENSSKKTFCDEWNGIS